MRETRTVGVIPARWGSTRLPGKSLIAIGGKPLIQWVLEAVGRARRLDLVLVATDDERIRAVVEAAGARAVMTRPDHPSGTDRVAEAVRDEAADVVINIQGDEPFIEPALIDRLAETMADEPDWDMATAARPIRDEAELRDPSAVKVVWGQRHRALYFSRLPIPFIRDAGFRCEGALHWRHLGIYAYRRAFLERVVREPPCLLEQAEKLEQLRALHMGCKMAVIETQELGIGIDTPADVAYAEQLLLSGEAITR